jgi:hypothetical protein
MLSILPRLVLAVLAGLASPPALANPEAAAAAWRHFQVQAGVALQELASENAAAPLRQEHPVLELAFSSMFEPMGERGLEYSAQLRGLEGRHVQVTGHMVREGRRPTGMFLLTPKPVRIDGNGSGEIGDLPATVVYVLLAPEFAEALVGFRPGWVTVTGVLELGVQPERDGRNSVVRVRLDAAASTDLVIGN